MLAFFTYPVLHVLVAIFFVLFKFFMFSALSLISIFLCFLRSPYRSVFSVLHVIIIISPTLCSPCYLYSDFSSCFLPLLCSPCCSSVHCDAYLMVIFLSVVSVSHVYHVARILLLISFHFVCSVFPSHSLF